LHPAPRRSALLAILALLLPLGCGRESRRPPNVLLLVVDALRFDHVGAYGYERDTTPTIDKLAGESVLFTRAYSPGNSTRSSVPAMLTSLYPAATGVERHEDVLHSAVPTLAEALARAGYATAAFVTNPSLRPEVGFGRGFDVYDYNPRLEGTASTAERFETATRLQTRALEFLRGVEQRPFFVYIHYRDVHGPYVPPEPYDRRYWDPDAPIAAQRALTDDEYQKLGGGKRLDGLQTLEHYVSQYDGEVRYTDDRIAEFLAELDRSGRLENTVVIVTADHGEAFLEHGDWGHGDELYEEELHVPLIFRLPGRRHAGSRIDVPVSGVDLWPTLAGLTGTPAPSGVQGRSLVPMMEAGRGRERPLFADADGGRHSVHDQGWKLVLLKGGKRRVLFDLNADPGEQKDLFDLRPDKAQELLNLLAQHLRESETIRAKRPSHGERLDSETEAGLKALGYL